MTYPELLPPQAAIQLVTSPVARGSSPRAATAAGSAWQPLLGRHASTEGIPEDEQARPAALLTRYSLVEHCMAERREAAITTLQCCQADLE